MQPVSVHHVSINVSKSDESIAFYTDVLGGTVRADRPDFGFGGAWIDLGDAQVHLIEAAVPPNLGQHFAILVDDLDGAVAELRAKGLEVETLAREGYPATVIEEEAERQQADLIVIGTRGLSGLKHLLLGSIAERVVQRAPCPVLTVKIPS